MAYIDTSKVTIPKGFFEDLNVPKLLDWLNSQPTADVVEVKHGEWVRQKGRPEAICSECGREVVYRTVDNRWQFEYYCPHCGAKMDGKQKEAK